MKTILTVRNQEDVDFISGTSISVSFCLTESPCIYLKNSFFDSIYIEKEDFNILSSIGSSHDYVDIKDSKIKEVIFNRDNNYINLKTEKSKFKVSKCEIDNLNLTSCNFNKVFITESAIGTLNLSDSYLAYLEIRNCEIDCLIINNSVFNVSDFTNSNFTSVKSVLTEEDKIIMNSIINVVPETFHLSKKDYTISFVVDSIANRYPNLLKFRDKNNLEITTQLTVLPKPTRK
jgi:hypothetical protein